MKKPKISRVLLAAVAAGALHAQALAMEHGHAMEHDGMGAMAQDAGDATPGQGVINAVDAAGRSVNITHDPIPALSWPAMTMDLPVTEAVDLGSVGSGDKVDFGLVLGDDNVYRITELKKAD